MHSNIATCISYLRRYWDFQTGWSRSLDSRPREENLRPGSRLVVTPPLSTHRVRGRVFFFCFFFEVGPCTPDYPKVCHLLWVMEGKVCLLFAMASVRIKLAVTGCPNQADQLTTLPLLTKDRDKLRK